MSTAQHRAASGTVPLGRAGVLLVDLQNDFCHPYGVFSEAGLTLNDPARLVERINTLAQAARAGGHPVLWTRMVWDDEQHPGLLAQRSPFLAQKGLRRGTWGAELLDSLDTAPSDITLNKTRFSSFFDTRLEDILQRQEVEHLVVGGVRTDFCVESTVRDAFFRDFDVFVPSDAVAGYVNTLHENSLRVMNTVFAHVTTLEETVRLLEPTQPQPQGRMEHG